MEKPLISIIVPCYNVEVYLPKCIDSILSQTYSNLEIILVDDGSPDHCGEICDEYVRKDNRVKVIHKTNGGLSDARNVAIDIAKGEYITFVDSDDYVADNYVEYLLQLALENQCKLSVIQPCLFYEHEDCTIRQPKEYIECFSPQKAICLMFYQKGIETSAWGKLYHKSLFETGIRYPKGLMFEDNPVTFRLFNKSDKIVVSNQQLYFYMIRSNSIEGSQFDQRKMDSAVAIMKLMYDYPDITNQVTSAFRCKIVSLAFHFVLKMPSNNVYTQELYQYITRYRRKILIDFKARRKTQLACLVSFLGLSVTQAIFRKIDKRK